MTASSRSPACPVCEVHAESVFKVEGMDCHEEVAVLERRLKQLPGVEGFAAEVIGHRLRVKHDAARLSASAIADAVAETGMRAWLEHEEPTGAGRAGSRQRLVVASGIALGLGFLADLSGIGAVAARPAFCLAIVAGGAWTARRAWAAVRARSFDMTLLMTVAVVGAVAIGQWSEAATVMFLFALAQLLEVRSLDRARHAIRSLMELTPGDALVRRDGTDARVPVDDIRRGDTLVIRPGEKIPLDGVIAAGASQINQAPITGESLPVDKHPGDEVFAGSINGRGALEIEVTHLRRDTTLARIIKMVESAQAQRAPAQAFIDRFARFYTPAVIVLAVGVAAVPPLLFAEPVGAWLYRALVLLVISCPCALVISTPVAIVSALAAAARQGVLIKGGLHLERTGTVRCIAFDKTGTLTEGRPEVVEVISLGRVSAAEVVRTAAALESRSEHPVGQAILQHARALGVPLGESDAFQSLPGLGAEGRVDGRPALVGNHRLFEQRQLCSPTIDARLDELAQAGRTAVLVAHDGKTVGIIGVADRLRPSGRDAVDLLRRQGIERMVLLTGDNQGTARAIVDRLGLDECHAELLPEDKVAAVRALRQAYGSVAMVGDGVNDAPALAAADVGIAMGTAGTDAALETADIALMADELLKIPYAVRLSRATLRTVKVNIAISLIVKAAFLALAVAGVATLWMAIVADTGASLVVIANGLRLLRQT